MLSIARCRDLDCYEREVIDGREDYLSESGTSPGQWVGSLAAADGYAGIAQRDHLARAFSDRPPRRLQDDRTRPHRARLRHDAVAVEVSVAVVGTRLRRGRPLC